MESEAPAGKRYLAYFWKLSDSMACGKGRAFLVKYYGDATGQDIKAPLDTVTTKEHWFADAGTARTIWMPGISG